MMLSTKWQAVVGIALIWISVWILGEFLGLHLTWYRLVCGMCIWISGAIFGHMIK